MILNSALRVFRRGLFALTFFALASQAFSQVCFTPPTGLIGWWPGDGSGTNIAGTNQGSLLAGATANAVGIVGQGFNFNGTTAYVSIPDSVALRPAQFTIECWVRFNSLDSTGNSPAGQQYIVFKQNTRSGNFEGIYLAKERRATGDIFVFGTSSSAGVEVEVDSVAPIATNTWYHIAGVRGSNFIQLYVNGVFIGQTAVTFAQNYGTLPLFFGSSGQTFWDHKLSGTLDEVSLYNRPLSAAEIASVFNAGAAGKCKPNSAPSITAPPQNQSVPLGSNATFTVGASGNAPLTYQWQFGSTPIPGANSNILILTNVQLTDVGGYSVIVTNLNGSITSAVATLTVLLPPSISLQPTNATRVTGTSVTFASGATGTAPLVFRWRLNGTNLNNNARITGATTDTLTITGLQTNDTGAYTLFVTNTAGTATSDPAALVVNAPPAVTIPPGSQTVVVGSNASFSVAATGTAPLSYQWLRNGSELTDSPNIIGSTSSQLDLSNLQLSDSSTFQVIITNVAGAVTSAVVTLDVILPPTPPSITTPPDSLVVTAGTNVSFSVQADGTAPLAYRWQKNGTNLNNTGNVSGATSVQLNLSNVQSSDAANYRVVVTNIAGSVTSIVATLTVNVPPGITNQPQGQSVFVGTNVNFTVNATGTAPLSFQWSRDGVELTDIDNVSGSGTSNLTLTNVQLTDTASFTVVVTNVAGSITSAPAALVVTALPIQPSITTPPDSLVVNAGTNVSFSVLADGTAPLAYRWQKNGTNLNNTGNVSGATSVQLNLSNVQASDAANYRVVVTNTAGAVTSIVASLTVNVPPSISAQPQGRTVVAGTNVSFTVTSAGTAPLSFQWLRDGNPLSDLGNVSGSTTSNLTLTAVQTNDAASFTVIITNVAGSITSAPAALVVNLAPTPPSITTPPNPVIAIAGTNVSFSVLADGTAPLAYRWQKNGTNLNNAGNVSGATSVQLNLSNVQASDAANYRVVVTNTAGAVTSIVASLTVNIPPSISAQPQGRTVVAGTNVSFTVTSAGTAPLSFQWLRNGSPLSDIGNVTGSTTSNLTLSAVQTNDSASFTVVITNVAGSITSAPAALVVNPPAIPPSITTPPVSLVVNAGTNISFSVLADGTAPLSYQWRRNGTNVTNGGNISGATASQLNITNVQSSNAANYQVVVTNIAGSVTSIVASLTVNVPPSIAGQPTGQSVAPGANVSFFVAASGTAPLDYQWRFNGTNITNGGQFNGATTSVLSLTNAQTTNTGNFTVVITNIAGSITSSVAALAVTTGPTCTPAPSGLIGWWTGDGSAGDIAGGFNGTLQANATANAVGEVGPAFNFNGTTAYVSIPDNVALRPAQFTIECWVRFSSLNSTGNSPAGQQYIVFKQNSRSGNFEGIYLAKERRAVGDIFIFGTSSAAGVEANAETTTPIVTNQWYHLAGVRNANTLLLYVNGSLAAQVAVASPQDYGTLPLYFGTSGQSYWDHKLAGSLDEVSLYNRPLSAAEIAAIFNAGTAGKCKVPVAPTIIAQPTNQTIVNGGTVSFSVTASGGTPLFYQWFKDSFILTNGNNVSGATNPVLMLSSLSSADIGNYQVIVSNSIGAVTSVVASLSTGIPPGNDAFASAQTITGSLGSVNGNNANATKQSGEPNHAGNPGGHSVWYNWTAPSTSPVTFDTAMSAFDTVLAVYTGNSLNSLAVVSSNNDIANNNVHSRLTFTPVSGTVYRIAVDGAGIASGNITLRWAQASAAVPDLTIFSSAVNPRIVTETFASSSCAVMEGLIQAGSRRLIRFDTQTANSGNGNLVFGNPANNPLFVFAPCHAHYHFQNYMSYRLRNSGGQLVAVGLKVGFCVLDVFRWDPGAPNNALYNCNNQGIQAGWGDLYDSTLDGQWIDITGLPDGNYTMEMEANPQGIIQEKDYSNNLTTVPIAIGNPNAAPLNDNFGSAQQLLGGFTSVPGVTGNATKQSGEPNHAGDVGGHSVWYQWTAISTKAVTIDTLSSSFDTVLAVYTGSSLNNLNLVASNNDINVGTLQSRVTFNATAGTVYRIAVDGAGGASGNLVLTLNQTIGNDNFANCQFIGGPTGIAYGANAGASREANEPNHAGNSGGQSIWYCWTAPVSGSVTFDTLGSQFNTLLAVYSGTALNNLTLVASNDDIGGGTNMSRLTFNATGLTMYRIAIDGFNNDSGDSTLNWNLTANAPGLVASSGYGAMNVVAVPGGPKLTAGFLGEGEYQVHITGQPQQFYRVEISCDLINWSPTVATLSDDDGNAYFTDKTTMNPSLKSAIGDAVCGPGEVVGAPSQTKGRFYRAIAIPHP